MRFLFYLYIIAQVPFIVHLSDRVHGAQELKSNKVGGILEVIQANEVLFDAPCTNEPIENADTTSLVVRTTSTSTSERLLADNGTCAFLVVVHVSGGVAQAVGCCDECLAI